MRVCVVGAGPSGLTTVKQLLDERHTVVCFDQGSDVGGIWHRHRGDDDRMKVFDSLILTISMKLMAFSDFPAEGGRTFCDHKGYLEYLRRYADRFRLRDSIQFGTTVDSVERQGDRWRVRTTRDGKSEESDFDAVAICTGPFARPNDALPELAGFKGEVLHSSRYRSPEVFRGKRVLVVGLAESGADIVREAAEVGAKTTLCIRSYCFLLPRLFMNDYATDEGTLRAHHHEMWVRSDSGSRAERFPMAGIWGNSDLARRLFVGVAGLYGLVAAAARLGKDLFRRKRQPPRLNKLGEEWEPCKLDIGCELTQEHLDYINAWNARSHRNQGSWSQKVIFCKNVSFVPHMVNGRVSLNDSGLASAEDNVVRFQDGSSAEFDTIMLCTGFRRSYGLLSNVEIKDNNVRNLHKHCIHPDHSGTLAVIGEVRPFSGGIPICSEMQARYFAMLCSGAVALPQDMHRRIEREKRWEERWTEFSPRALEAIPSQVFFCDSIAREINCLMTPLQLLMEPRLLVRHWFSIFNQACYRMVGPHSTPDVARKALLDESFPMETVSHIFAFTLFLLFPRTWHPKDMLLPSVEQWRRTTRFKTAVSSGESKALAPVRN